MDYDGELSEVHSITLHKSINSEGELLIGWDMSEGMVFIEAVGLLEAVKLSMNELFRSGKWADDGDE